MSDERPRPWRVLASRRVIDTRYLRLRADTIALPDGSVVEDYFVRESRGFSVVLALDEAGRAVVTHQYKYGANAEMHELPAGGIDPGEDAETCARRELAEETGYTAERFVPVRSFLIDPTNADGRFHLFVARGARRTETPQPEPTERITVEVVALDELRRMALDGRIAAGSQVAAVLVGLAWLENAA